MVVFDCTFTGFWELRYMSKPLYANMYKDLYKDQKGSSMLCIVLLYIPKPVSPSKVCSRISFSMHRKQTS